MDIYSFASGGIINLHKAEIKAADGSKHSLGHKENELLRLLLTASPDVVDKNTITETVWQRPVISESAISVAIAKLRKLLRNISKDEIEIITAKGVGYRLTLAPDVQVKAFDDKPASGPSSVQAPLRSSGQSVSPETLLTDEEKDCLQDVNTFEDEDYIEQKFGSLYWKHCLILVILAVSLSAFSYLSWVYGFTKCRELVNGEAIVTSGNIHQVRHLCWSEIAERDALRIIRSVDVTEASVVLIDKDEALKLYTQDGELINND